MLKMLYHLDEFVGGLYIFLTGTENGMGLLDLFPDFRGPTKTNNEVVLGQFPLLSRSIRVVPNRNLINLFICAGNWVLGWSCQRRPLFN